MRDSSNNLFCSFSCLSPSLSPSAPTNSSHCRHDVAKPAPLPIVAEKELSDDEFGDVGEAKFGLKSSLRKPVGPGSEGARKGSVRWRDSEGEELADIMEFERIESGELENAGNIPTCMCVIL